MAVDNSSTDGATDVVDEELTDGPADASDAVAAGEVDGDEETEPDKVERAAQGLITIGMFIAFVTFIIFCLPMYFFN